MENHNTHGRRQFLTMACAATAAWAVERKGGAAEAAAPMRPNIVYVLADDLGYGDVGCFNPDSKIPTRNIDRLAGEGMRFTDAHSGSAVCTPTRYGILTGRYAWRTHLKAHVLEAWHPPLIEKDRLTVASLLKARGYRTACVGKWHLGLGWSTTDGHTPREDNLDTMQPLSDSPLSHGFDFYFGIPASLDMAPYVYIENDHALAPPTGEIATSAAPPFYRAGHIAPGFKHEDVLPTLTRKAVACIDEHAAQHKDAPLFLYFPLSAPHAPIMPLKDFNRKSKAGIYGDFVCEVDWAVGQVMEALERNGMANDTLFIFTSDNGPAPVADLKVLHTLGHDAASHFRGAKADIYEGGHRVPFIAKWPGRIKAGTTCGHIACLTDFMATLAELGGQPLPPNAGEDSISLLPAFLGTAPSSARRDIVHHSANGLFAMRQENWKLEFCPGSGGWSEPKDRDAEKQGLPPVQLYNLASDIDEKINIQEKHPDVVRQLSGLLQKYIDDGRSTPGSKQQNEGRTSLWGTRGRPSGAS